MALLAGATDVEAAASAGVRRETVNRWKHSDPHFVAELNRRRREAWEAGAEALRSLLPRTVRALAEALESGCPATRLRAAGLVLKTLGLGEQALRPPQGPTESRSVESGWESQRRVAEECRAIEALFAPVVGVAQ